MELSPVRMSQLAVAGKISQIKAPDHTQQEVQYLQRLVDERIPVRVRLSDNQEVEGLDRVLRRHALSA